MLVSTQMVDAVKEEGIVVRRRHYLSRRDIWNQRTNLVVVLWEPVCVCVCVCVHVCVLVAQLCLTLCDPMGCISSIMEFSRQEYWSG